MGREQRNIPLILILTKKITIVILEVVSIQVFVRQNTGQPMRDVRGPEQHEPLRPGRPGGRRAQPRGRFRSRLPRRPSPALWFRGLRGPRGSRGGWGAGGAGGLQPEPGEERLRSSRRGGGGRTEETARLGSAKGPRWARGGLGRPAVGSGFAPRGPWCRRGGMGPCGHARAAEPHCSAGTAAPARAVPAERSGPACAPSLGW